MSAAIITPGATYEIKQICAKPLAYVAFVTSIMPHTDGVTVTEPVHFEGKTLPECLRLVASHLEASERTNSALSGFLKTRADALGLKVVK